MHEPDPHPATGPDGDGRADEPVPGAVHDALDDQTAAEPGDDEYEPL